MISIQCEFDDPSSVKSVMRLANLGHFSAQMTLKVKVNQHHFQQGFGGSQDTNLMQIGDPSLNSENATVIALTSSYLKTDGRTDGRTDRRTDGGDDNTPSAEVAEG